MGHLHLALNHFPVVGLFFTIVLLAFGLKKNSEDLKVASLWAFIAVAILALGAYFTGEYAEDMVEHMPGVTEAVIHAHETAALVALIFIEVLGALSIAAVVLYRKHKVLHGGILKGLMVFSLIALILIGRTANLGGQVRHTEVRPGFPVISGGGEGAEAPEEEESDGDGMPEPANK